jgi:hypothetical protein
MIRMEDPPETQLRQRVRAFVKLNVAFLSLRLSLSGSYVSINPSVVADFSTSVRFPPTWPREEIVRFVTTVLEDEFKERTEPLPFSFGVATSVIMNVAVANELARIATQAGRCTVLREVSFVYSSSDHVPAFVQMLRPGSSVRKLVITEKMMNMLADIPPDCSLEELEVTPSGVTGFAIAKFARALHVKNLTLRHWVVGGEEMPELESLTVDVMRVGVATHPFDFLEWCPNLVSLRLESVRVYDMAIPFFHISFLKGLRELYVCIDQGGPEGWQRDAVDSLSHMTNLRKLELHVYGFTNEMQDYIFWSLPRLDYCEIDEDGVGAEWEWVISRKRNWLCWVALTVAFGDLSRELAEYI